MYLSFSTSKASQVALRLRMEGTIVPPVILNEWDVNSGTVMEDVFVSNNENGCAEATSIV